ncbi:tyrosine-type recombinase/integrase [Vibrio sp. OPT18]|uniref:phage integrase n=2 Tax=Vibrio sp. OPT18 TaxID=2778641 RepID=UPI00188243FA|nr:tyrosine-type recombinase/integrase [Vibrio sp. OPT18]MBE8578661.1 tyrosine-type recombinase/integrase [Vibrio sp. OPT18]
MLLENEWGFYSSLDPHRVYESKRKAIQHDKRLSVDLDIKNVSKDKRPLEEFVTIWYRLHGKTLRDHVRLRKLLYKMVDRLGNPIASDFTSEDFAKYREMRSLEVATATVNREHSYLRAMFNELDRLGVIKFENPLTKMRQFKERAKELRYLEHEEIGRLLRVCSTFRNKSLLPIVKICLATGARWGEAENLKPAQIKNNSVTFLNTKSNKNRTVPINQVLFDELKAFKPVNDERMFLSSLSTFRKAITKAHIQLPKGQFTHVLRHTFASHYVMNGGNIVKLRDVLGHSEITTTMRYAHLAPDHLEETLKLNPLNRHQNNDN